jgi:2-desacetyl-2-hydroxyethyl bacteriochlorophyllide A dehydrogenase
MQRKIIVFAEPRKVELRSTSTPAMDADSVRVRTTVTSISRGTELNLYHGRTREIRGVWYATYPLVPGYEIVGRVQEVGANVTHVQPGDRVVATITVGGYEGYCNAWGGQTEYAMCTVASEMGSEYIEPVKIPDNVSDEEAAMSILATVPLNGIEKKLSFVGPGMTVAVLGQGGMGISAGQFHHRMGARVIVADEVPERAEIASRGGWAESVCGRSDELIEPIKELTDGGPDVVHDCSGSLECLHAAVEMVKEGGTVLGTGLYLQPITFDLCPTLWTRCITFACCVGASPVQRAKILKWISEGTFDAKCMVGETFALEQAAEAYRRLDKEPHQIIKPIIRWWTP